MKVLQILVLIFGFVVLANAQKAILSGTVYDANGAVILDTKITAINDRGEKFKALTNDEGIYILDLPFDLYDRKTSAGFKIAKYEITVEHKHFKKYLLKDFNFVPSYKGKMYLDIALDVDNSNCGVAGCLPNLQPVESPDLKISDKILQKPLEELPKEQNKTKRKNKNNKQ